MSASRFFSPLVRIQQERGHQVADSGPCKIIRHSGYLGGIGFSVGVPLLLGSLWALIPGMISAGLYVLRTKLEDHALAAELPGYWEYLDQVRYRLIPGVW